jgi:hypothetical protein
MSDFFPHVEEIGNRSTGFEKISRIDPFARRRGCIARLPTPRRHAFFQRGSAGPQLVCMAPLVTAPCI